MGRWTRERCPGNSGGHAGSSLPFVGAAEVDELRTLADPLEGSSVEMVNSTAVGGGVAELLTRVLPLMRSWASTPIGT